MPRRVEISHRTIIFTVLFLLFLGFLFKIRDILLELFVALILMTILNPLVTKLSKLKIPRVISVAVVYLLIFGIIGFAIASFVPALIEQTTNFANNLPDYLKNLGSFPIFGDQLSREIISRLGDLPAKLIGIGISIFSNILQVIAVLIFTFYLLLARDRLDNQLASFFGDDRQKKIKRMVDSIEIRLGGWARGELVLMFTVGTANYIGLVILGVPFALPLAILAGFLEIVPTLGPILAAIPAVLIGFSISPLIGLAVAALAFLIQQLENYVLVPKIMEKSVGVDPIIVLLALAIGLRIAGVVGALISVPVVITLQILSKEYLSSKESS